MSGIFISYRRELDAGWAGRLAADLKRDLPDQPIFHDIASIEIGEDFGIAIQRALGHCAVLLVVIGPRWLDAQHPHGGRRLDDEDDWVRIEILAGLQGKLRVVPVLVGGAIMPSAKQLPDALKPLVRRNAHEITDKRWDYDVGELIKALRRVSTHAAGRDGAEAPSQVGHPTVVAAPPPRILDAHDLPAPGTAFRHGPDFPELVVVPAGHFLMGSPQDEKDRDENEGPCHPVTIARPFAVGRYPVTFAEWDAFVAAGGTTHRPDDKGWGRGRQPVIHVSWDDAQAYVAWLREQTGQPYRLLSEAEWEYAARAGSQTRYPWGDEPGKDKANFRGSSSQFKLKRTAPVDSFPANAFGLCDMVGNIREWVEDSWHANYQGAPDDGRPWDGSGEAKTVRGGSWNSPSYCCRAACRNRDAPRTRQDDLGFRVCCAPITVPVLA